MVNSADSKKPERSGILGDLASRVQEGVRATIEALVQSDAQRLAAIVESSDDAIISIDLDGIIATWNDGAQKVLGYAADEVIGKPVTILIPPDREGEEVGILARIKRGEPTEHYKTRRRRRDGAVIDISLTVSPIKDGAGKIIGASKIARDITEHELALKSVARRMNEQAALYQFTDRLFRARSHQDIYEAALDAILQGLGCERASILRFDDSGIMKFVAWRGLSDRYRQAVEGHSPWTRESKDPQAICVGDIDTAELDSSLKTTVKGEGIGALAFIPLAAQGNLIGKFMTYYATSHAFTEGELDLAVTIARQLGFALERAQAEDSRRHAEEAKELLLAESRHRIKNTLATVQAIAGQTLRHIPKVDQQAFLARLHALGEAHDLLSLKNWDRALLGDVINRALKPFQTGKRQRCVVKGPEVWLPAQKSLLLTLVFHELATNAAKYGAFSNTTGRVRVIWDVIDMGNGRGLNLLWRETGGPPVTAPAHKGFGSTLIEQSFNGDEETRFEFSPKGLNCFFKLSLRAPA